MVFTRACTSSLERVALHDEIPNDGRNFDLASRSRTFFRSFDFGRCPENFQNALHRLCVDKFLAGLAVQHGGYGGDGHGAVDIEGHDVPSHCLLVLSISEPLGAEGSRRRTRKDGSPQKQTSEEER